MTLWAKATEIFVTDNTNPSSNITHLVVPWQSQGMPLTRLCLPKHEAEPLVNCSQVEPGNKSSKSKAEPGNGYDLLRLGWGVVGIMSEFSILNWNFEFLMVGF